MLKQLFWRLFWFQWWILMLWFQLLNFRFSIRIFLFFLHQKRSSIRLYLFILLYYLLVSLLLLNLFKPFIQLLRQRLLALLIDTFLIRMLLHTLSVMHTAAPFAENYLLLIDFLKLSLLRRLLAFYWRYWRILQVLEQVIWVKDLITDANLLQIREQSLLWDPSVQVLLLNYLLPEEVVWALVW